MRATNIGRVLTALALVMASASAQAADKSAPAKSAPAKAAAPAVVLLGTAMLEEYHGGDPSSRTTISRGGDSARKATKAAKPKA